MIELTDIIKQIDLAHIYRTFHQNTEVYTFFSPPHRILSKIDTGTKQGSRKRRKLN